MPILLRSRDTVTSQCSCADLDIMSGLFPGQRKLFSMHVSLLLSKIGKKAIYADTLTEIDLQEKLEKSNY